MIISKVPYICNNVSTYIKNVRLMAVPQTRRCGFTPSKQYKPIIRKEP